MALQAAMAATMALLVGCAAPKRIDPLAAFRGDLASLPKEWAEEPIITLRDSISIRLIPGKDANRVEHSQVVWHYVNRRNPNALEQVVISDFKSIESIPHIEAKAWFPDGGTWAPGPMEISRVRHAEEELHSSDRWLNGFRFPRYLQGMVIRLRVVRTFHRPEFLKSELLRDEHPSLSKTVDFSYPKGWSVKHGLLNAEGLKVDSVRVAGASGTETEGVETLTLRATRLPKLEARAMPRNPESWLAALHFSLPARGDRSLSWIELGDAYLASIGDAFANTAELEKLAAGLPKEQPDSLIRRVYTLLRGRIRYHADLGVLHTFVPRKAGVVLAKGYGDCKEMATLMTQILRLRGLKAGVALVSTPGNLSVVPEFPTLGGFNHMIAYAEMPDGSARFFDPTVKHGDPADSYYELIDRSALVLRPGASALAPVPMGPGYKNRVETRSAIRPGAGGQGWSLVGSIKLEGQCAFSLLPTLDAAVGEEKGPLLKVFLKELFAVDASDARVISTGARSIEVTYEASYTGNYLAMDKGGLLMSWPSLYGGDVRFTGIDVEGPRYVQKFEQSDVWDIPSGFDELEKEDLVHGIGRGAWSRKGATVRRTYASENAVVPADEKDKLSDYLRRKNRFVRATLWHR